MEAKDYLLVPLGFFYNDVHHSHHQDLSMRDKITQELLMEKLVHKAIATYEISPSSSWRSSNALGKPSVKMAAFFWIVSTCLPILEMDSLTLGESLSFTLNPGIRS